MQIKRSRDCYSKKQYKNARERQIEDVGSYKRTIKDLKSKSF